MRKSKRAQEKLFEKNDVLSGFLIEEEILEQIFGEPEEIKGNSQLKKNP
jgi:hypothetical protein